MAFDGIVNLYKEQGFTSFDAVAKLRGIFGQKRIGHTGTLDPMAEGVLLICLGRATKIAELIASEKKSYKAVLRLGTETDTDDITGKVLSEKPVDIESSAIEELFKGFTGELLQVPPKYAAIKKNGKKLYEYARAGIEIEIEPRPVTIYRLDILDISLPFVTFFVECSKGTYIRSLCRDIGRAAGCGGTMESLVRTEVNGFLAENAVRLETLDSLKKEERLGDAVMPIDSILKDVPAAVVRNDYLKLLHNGNKLPVEAFQSGSDFEELKAAGFVRIYEEGDLAALYKYDDGVKAFKVFKMLLN